MPEKPNIIFIFSDQQNVKAMSCAGNRWLHTPHLDRLAAAGSRFEISYCTTPVCGPARASLFTGLMPHQHGVEINTAPLPDGMPTVGNFFREAGYDSYYIGKWHVGPCFPQEKDYIPGFYNDAVGHNALGEVTDSEIVDKTLKYLFQTHEKPFLLAVSLQNPHDICHWIMKDRMELLEKYSPGPNDELPPLPANFAISEYEPEFIKMTRLPKDYGRETKYTASWTEEDWRKYLFVYYRLNEELDRQVGRILEAIEENGLTENTIIVFSSDHGEGGAEHQLVVKLQLYDGAAAVPFIIKGQGIPQGHVESSTPVSGIDLVPTLCDYANIAIPKDLPGKSLKAVLETQGLEDDSFVVTELSPFKGEKEEMKARMLRTSQWKYIRFAGLSGEQLFDMKNDPGETKNLVNDPVCQEVLEKHRTLLNDWCSKTNDDKSFGINL